MNIENESKQHKSFLKISINMLKSILSYSRVVNSQILEVREGDGR